MIIKRFWAVVLCLLIISTADATPRTCRSSAVKKQFDKQMGYPTGRKGYIVDHICSLFNGGIDDTRNMQYQTKEASKKKDLIENTEEGKKLFCTPENSTPTRQVFNCK